MQFSPPPPSSVAWIELIWPTRQKLNQHRVEQPLEAPYPVWEHHNRQLQAKERALEVLPKRSHWFRLPDLFQACPLRSSRQETTPEGVSIRVLQRSSSLPATRGIFR